VRRAHDDCPWIDHQNVEVPDFLSRYSSCLDGGIRRPSALVTAPDQGRQELCIEAVLFISKRVARSRGPEVSRQLFLEALCHECRLDVPFQGDLAVECQVGVPCENRLVVQLVCLGVQGVQAVGPAADEDQLTSPRIQRLHQLCECFQVVHSMPCLDQRLQDLAVDEVGLLLTTRWVIRDIQPDLENVGEH